MRSAILRFAALLTVLIGLVSHSPLGHTHHESPDGFVEGGPVGAAAQSVLHPTEPKTSETADFKAHCSGVFLAGDPIAVGVPAIPKGRHDDSADSDIVAALTSPDPPPPRL